MSSSSGRWHSVPLTELEGGRAVVAADGHEVLLLHVGGAVHALANACPHEGNPLADGKILGDQLECAYHGWRFDLESGACLVGARSVRRYDVEVAGEEIRIRLGLPGSETI
jgi:nitrite reductase/ring-hydroxylating ferredoxin subunit